VRQLYPPIEPYRTSRLHVSTLHELYVEESGNPEGQPVVFVHGGPGGGTSPEQRRFFDPASYRIGLFDQRGSGRSTPHASLVDNTTWHLVADMERIRERLGIEGWVVFGGSWGSTLALAYAETHPGRVRALVLRGIFLLRLHELRWFYQEGASLLFPDAWEAYLEPIPVEERGDLIAAYHRRLTGEDPAERARAARAWSGPRRDRAGDDRSAGDGDRPVPGRALSPVAAGPRTSSGTTASGPRRTSRPPRGAPPAAAGRYGRLARDRRS